MGRFNADEYGKFHIDAVLMTAPNHPSAAVFVPADATANAMPAIDRALECVREKHVAEGDAAAPEFAPARERAALSGPGKVARFVKVEVAT